MFAFHRFICLQCCFYMIYNMNNNDQSLETMICPVCSECRSQFYQIADCGHAFCQACCIAYIESQATSFNRAKCLQQNCGAELNKNKNIYKKLSRETVGKINKFQRFDFLQKKTDAKICKVQQCQGYFMKTDKKGQCVVCRAEHCNKCFEFKHDGACVTTAEQKEMKALNYKRCPRCGVWVQKIAGCEFISCKCGIEFCYKCGSQFSKDPCRKQPLWQKQLELRKLLKELQLHMPDTAKQALLIVPRVMLSLILILPFTIIFCTLPLIVTLALFALLIFIISPLMLGYPISMIDNKTKRILCYLALVIFYPLIGSFFTLIFLIVVLLYPLLRQKYHYGIYDPIDLMVAKFAVWYLQFVVKTFNLSKSCC